MWSRLRVRASGTRKGFVGQVLLLLVAVATGGCSKQSGPVLSDTQDATFQVGQVWLYDSNLEDDRSTLVIGKVEQTEADGEKQVIVHVSLEGLAIEHPDDGIVTSIPHMPFSKAALQVSVLGQIGTGEIPADFQDSYDQWRSDYTSGEAGIFEIPVGRAIADVVAALGDS